jgi:hypothetical protein
VAAGDDLTVNHEHGANGNTPGALSFASLLNGCSKIIVHVGYFTACMIRPSRRRIVGDPPYLT